MSANLNTFLKRGISQLNEYGLELLYWRYIHRRMALFKAPIHCPPDSDLEVHIQICARDWLNGLWTLNSFHYFTENPFRLVLLHDGWLDTNHKIVEIYNQKFPGVISYKRMDLEPLVKEKFSQSAPTVMELWLERKYFTLAKVVDSFLLRRNRYYLSLDPDVLFFARPDELLNGHTTLNGKSACWNVPKTRGHSDGMFCFTPNSIYQLTGLHVPVPFGTGLGCLDSNTFDWELAELVLSKMQIPENLIFMLDQTLFALFSAKYNFVPLSRKRYAIDPVESLEGVVARHYYGKTRDLMYIEGIKNLRQVLNE